MNALQFRFRVGTGYTAGMTVFFEKHSYHLPPNDNR